jgi:hypothetical protein
MRISDLQRRVMIGVVLAMAVIVGTGGWLSHVEKSTREREMIRHTGHDIAFADSLEASLSSRPAPSIKPAEALAALYLERLRLGLGSPFRLVDQVLRDVSLDPISRTRLAEAMLARTMMGEAYRPRSSALDLLHVGGVRGTGAEHQAIIDSVVASYEDPRVGELAIRLAYRLASASGVLSRRAPEIATAAAAQSRDRVLAMRDARALLLAADRDGVSRTTLFKVWREARKFAVERPVIVPLSERGEREAVASLPVLVARVESVGSMESGFVETARAVLGQQLERSRGGELTARMASVALGRDHPPLAPVLVAVRAYRGLLRSSGAPTMSERAARARFAERVQNEETLAAEYALLVSRTPASVPEADAALLTAAVALRALAQERAWLPGDPAPTARDLQARFGVTVTYDAGARTSWRPFFQKTLEQSLVDMRRVLPGFDPRGLRVHFGTSPLGDRALALHDPMRRTIYFPPASHSGVMAHEYAHDLDWQAARRAYGGTGWYRTDHALRQSVDQLAGALRQMASATRGGDSAAARMTGTARPTEVLARNVDWFVSASLAREGRTNGHLSAAQDPVLTGYASAITPEAARDGGSATLRALDGLTTVPQVTRAWFSGLFGAERRLGVHEAVRRVLEAPMGRFRLEATPSNRQWDPRAFDAGAVQSASWSCLVESFAGKSSDAGTLRALVQYAAEARARGIVREWAAFARHRPYASPPRLRALTGAPWDPAIERNTLREVRDAILWAALNQSARAAEGGWLSTPPSSGC